MLQALEKLPADRFASAPEFSAALAGSPSAAGAGSRKFTAAHRPQVRPASRPPVLLAGAVRVSLEGGTEPIWGRDGRSLYFRGPVGEVVRVEVSAEGEFSLGARRTLHRSDYLQDVSHPGWDVAPDGRLLLLQRAGEESQLLVVHGWGRELREKVGMR